MKNIECESCIKRKTMFCPNSSKCWNTEDKPYWQNRIMLLEENQKLKDEKNKQRKYYQNRLMKYQEKINNLQSVIDELKGEKNE